MNKEALIKDLNEVYNLVSDHDTTEAMQRLEFVIGEVKQLHIPVVSQQRELLLAYEDYLNEYHTKKDRIKQVEKYLKDNNCG